MASHGGPRNYCPSPPEPTAGRTADAFQHERGALPCLEPGRADLIVPGVAIVLASLDVTRTDGVVVSDWGLREGMMADAIDRLR